MRPDLVIDLEGVTIRYGRVTAVDELSLQVARKSVYALLGRNGSGKSSTVRCLLGQRRASSGTLRILGMDVWRDRRQVMEHVGVVPENPDVPPETTAVDVARFMARVTPRWGSQKFFGWLDEFGVPKNQRFDRLSKGQQRQLALALALAGTPKLLVLDDPTLGLDAVARRDLYQELIGDLADRGTTVFLTTHDLTGVEAIADRIGVLREGELMVDEPLEALKMRFCRLVWTGGEQVPKEKLGAGLKHLGVIATEQTGGSGEAVVGGFSEVGFGRFREAAPVEVMRVDTLSLEEIFITLCGKDGDRP